MYSLSTCHLGICLLGWQSCLSLLKLHSIIILQSKQKGCVTLETVVLCMSVSVVVTSLGNSASWSRLHSSRIVFPIWVVLAENFSIAWNMGDVTVADMSSVHRQMMTCHHYRDQWCHVTMAWTNDVMSPMKGPMITCHYCEQGPMVTYHHYRDQWCHVTTA